MIEFIAVLLTLWCIYCFATGKFKNEYQDQQKVKLKQNFEKIKQNLKNILNKNQHFEVKKEIESLRKLNPRNQDYRIHYEDFNKDFSVRIISIDRLYKENRHWYIDAYCHSVRDDRTFRVDRIQYIVSEKYSIQFNNSKQILNFLKNHFY